MEAKRICPYCMGELENRVSVCPHCGAPLEINASAKCPYCGSVITLEEHGFHQYEISNFALPGRESRHNLKY